MAITVPSAESEACLPMWGNPDFQLAQRDGHLGIHLSIEADGDGAATLLLTIAKEAVVHVPLTHMGGDKFAGFLQLSPKHEQAILRGQALLVEANAILYTPDGRERVNSRGQKVSTFIGGTARSSGTLGADRLMFIVLALALFGILIVYRSEKAPLDRIRLAAAGGLVCVLFVCTSMAMPWSQSDPIGGERGLCSLGQEADCIAPLSLIDPTVIKTDERLERASWAAAGIRAGQVTLVLILLPAFIWLLVAPGSRAAQSLVVGGALPAVFLAVSSATYYLAMAPGSVRRAGAADLTLLAASAVILVTGVTIGYGRQLVRQSAIPSARVRRGRRRP